MPESLANGTSEEVWTLNTPLAQSDPEVRLLNTLPKPLLFQRIVKPFKTRWNEVIANVHCSGGGFDQGWESATEVWTWDDCQRELHLSPSNYHLFAILFTGLVWLFVCLSFCLFVCLLFNDLIWYGSCGPAQDKPLVAGTAWAPMGLNARWLSVHSYKIVINCYNKLL